MVFIGLQPLNYLVTEILPFLFRTFFPCNSPEESRQAYIDFMLISFRFHADLIS